VISDALEACRLYSETPTSVTWPLFIAIHFALG